MKDFITLQNRNITSNDINFIRQLIANNPAWGRTQLSRELCKLWNWQAHNGQLKDMACRTLLLKLNKLNLISLPKKLIASGSKKTKRIIPFIPHDTSIIEGNLNSLGTIRIENIQDKKALPLFNCLLSKYHYLGYSGSVGENMKYIVFDQIHRPLACLLFGSAAWKIAPRDSFIGWNSLTQKQNLFLITNNMRFLILPWVLVPNLASFILSKIASRISTDWTNKYNHPISLLETFVDRSRFFGTCYKAANWLLVGQSKGRSRNDTFNSIRVPVKDIYLFPLSKNFKEVLNHE
ncbi:MAG: DUF4338 domain-containing protein [Nanoarchaeota archaeon]|nr:DUF4338 domain-containing protein [Nanoarchaeota archaeon]